MLGPEDIDRCCYQLSVTSELKKSLRSGDVSVGGSCQFRACEDYRMPHSEFDRGLMHEELRVTVLTYLTAFIEERMALSQSSLDQTKTLAREDRLPDAE